MQADFSIECGADDECLEMPWASEDGALRYVDLKQNPALIADLEEARRFPELAEFLRSANSPLSAFETAKCDAWFTREMTAEDEVFGTAGKFGSYADLLFTSPALRNSFAAHETAAANLTQLLRRAPEMQASAEFLAGGPGFHGFDFLSTNGLLGDGVAHSVPEVVVLIQKRNGERLMLSRFLRKSLP